MSSLRRLFSGRGNVPEALNHETIGDAQREMIRGVLDLAGMNAREIMVPRVDITAVPSDVELKALVDIISDAGHSRIPVYEETIDTVIGVLYAKDLLEFLSDGRRKYDIKKLLRKPLFIPETMPLDDLLREFKKKRQHLAIVIDEYGGIAGIVTMEDILEEIVGEINDEFDENEPAELIKINRTTYEVDTRMSLEDLNETLGLKLPSDDFDTVGGYVLDLFGKIPAKNESAAAEGITFRIKDIKGTRIGRIIVTVTRTKQTDGKG